MVEAVDTLRHSPTESRVVTIRMREVVAEMLPRQKTVLWLKRYWHERNFYLRVEQGEEPGVVEVRLDTLCQDARASHERARSHTLIKIPSADESPLRLVG